MIEIPNTTLEPPVFKIFKYVRDGVAKFDPLAIDDKKDVTIRFAVKTIIDEKGFKTSEELYESDVVTIDPVSKLRSFVYSELIKRTDITYIIGDDDALLSRTESYSMTKEDDSIINVGSKTKDYTGSEGITEGIKRRDNVINLLKQTTAYLLLVTEPTVITVPDAEVLAKLIGNDVGIQIANFVSFNAYNELINGINASTIYYLDNPISATETIRTKMVQTIEDSKI